MADRLESPSVMGRIAPYALIAAITLAAFWPVFTLEFIRFDDTIYVTDNPGVKQGLSFQGMRYAATAYVCGHYHPLTILSHQLDVSLFRLRPMGHHAVNLLFHIANACLVFRLLSTMTGAQLRSLLVAALFAVHPLRVESVAWVSERKDVLSTLFMFLSMGAYVVYVRNGKRTAYARSLLFFALALLAKPMPVTMPFVLLLFDRWPLRRTIDGGLRDYIRELPGLAAEKWPFFAMSAAWSIVTYVAQSGAGATRSLDAFPLTGRAANAIVACATYLGKMLVPVGLAPHYPLTEYSTVRVTASLASLIVITLVALATFRRRPYVFVGWFWFVGMLVPVIGLVQAGNQAMADRFTYVPMIGVTMALVWLAGDLLESRGTVRRVAVGVAGLAVVLSIAATFHQTRYWKDSITLFTRTLEVSPRSSVAHKILGIAYAKDGKVEDALAHFQRAMQLNPRDRDSAFNLGTALLILGRADEAIPLLDIAVAAYEKPADAYTNLGRALMDERRSIEARDVLRKALAIDPKQNGALLNLGIVEGMLGNVQLSVDTLAETARRAPDNPEAHYNYGIALLNAGRNDDAARAFEEALRLRPDFPDAAAQLEQARGQSGTP